VASADYTVIDALLIPEHADWNIRFASNEMVIAFREDSQGADLIDKDNWIEILMREDVAFGRSAPNLDPAGYRTVLTATLAEKFYGRPGLAEKMLAKDTKYVRSMSADLLALLEVGELDYVFTYRSVAEQHKLAFVTLPDEINFSKPELSELYRTASIRLTGKQRGTFITKVGEPIVYGVTIPKNAPNPKLAADFLAFMLDSDKGGEILRRNGHARVSQDVRPSDHKGGPAVKPARRSRTDALSLLFAALGGALLLFIIAPLASLGLSCSLPELAETAIDSEVQASIWLTLWTSMAATVLFAIAGIPFAYFLARKDFPLKGLVSGIIDVPVVIPHVAAGIALLTVLARGAAFGRAGHKMGVSFVGTSVGIMLAMAFVSVPFLINAAREGFEAVPERIEKAALSLGASPLRVFLTVSVPMAARPIVSGMIMMWARGMSEFGAVIIIAYNPMTAPVLMFEQFGAYGLKSAQAVAVLFIAICLVFFVVLRLLAGGKRNAQR